MRLLKNSLALTLPPPPGRLVFNSNCHRRPDKQRDSVTSQLFYVDISVPQFLDTSLQTHMKEAEISLADLIV